MKMLLRLILGLGALAVVLLLAVIVAVLLFVDPNDYRDEIAAAVEEQTGRTLSIDGELGLSLLPCCGIELGETTLSNPPGFETPQFAKVDGVRLGLAVWPLLTERALVIGEIDLQGLDVELVRLADGRDNWTFAASEAEADRVTAEAPAEGAPAGAQATSLSVAGVNIGNARLVYRDAVESLDLRLEELNVATGAITPGEPFDLSTSFRLQDATDGTQAAIDLRAIALLDLDAERAELDDATLLVEASGPALPADSVDARLSLASLDYDLAADSASVADISGQLGLKGGDTLPADSADVQFGLAALGYNGESGAVNISGVTANIDAVGGALPADGAKASLTLDEVNYNLESGAATLKAMDLSARGAGAELRASGEGVLREGATDLRGRFELPSGSPRDWLSALGEAVPETTDPAVLSRLAASGNWALEDDAVALNDLSVQLDDTQIAGRLGVANFATPRVRIALDVDAIDVDRYLAPAQEGGSGTSADGEATALPREELRDLYLDGTLKIGTLLVGGLTLEQVQATATARDGVLTLEPLRAALYGGQYDGSIRLDGTGAKTKVQMRQSLDAVQVASLLTDLADVEQLEGLVVAKLDLNGAGTTDAELKETLAGTVTFELSDGVYKGLDIWHEIRTVRARVKGDIPPERTGPAQTEITALDFGGRLTDGVLNSERMIAQLPFLRVTGDGSLSLADESLDYRFNARVMQVPEFPDGATLDDLEGWNIPLRLGGTLEQPKLGVDLAEFAKTRAAQELQNKLFDKLGLGDKDDDKPASGDGEAPDTSENAQPQQENKRDDPEDILKQGLKDLFGR
jgi:AsmA protein